MPPLAAARVACDVDRHLRGWRRTQLRNPVRRRCGRRWRTSGAQCRRWRGRAALAASAKEGGSAARVACDVDHHGREL